ncbi:MAG TPA: SRPBCC domain-containing protein [Candidatus Anoxymicrobiaceae bacterium]
MAFEVRTSIGIDAPSERVWRVLSDLDAYGSWNPMIRSASGKLVEGSRLDLRFEPEGRKPRHFRPRLLVVAPASELRWLGNPGVPGFFESEHYFRLEPDGGAGCRLEHNMLFRGLFVRFARKRMEDAVLEPFEQMNAALKERAERQV